jgi:TonB family protein
MTRAIFIPAIIAAACIASFGTAHAASPATVQAEPMFVTYPQDAFARNLEGRVGVELSISAAGAVEDCRVVHGVAQSLDEASCHFWKRTQFRAAYDDRGQPVASVVRKFSDWNLPR